MLCSPAETPECWNLQFQTEAIFADNFLSEFVGSSIPGFLQDLCCALSIEGRGHVNIGLRFLVEL